MRLSEVQKKAKGLGMRDPWKYPKKELIRMIQRKEGNFDCFASMRSYCEQMSCCWRSDCIR